jgi:hypothetical protein
MCLFEKISVNTIVPTNPIVCAILSMSENPIIPLTIRQMEYLFIISIIYRIKMRYIIKSSLETWLVVVVTAVSQFPLLALLFGCLTILDYLISVNTL